MPSLNELPYPVLVTTSAGLVVSVNAELLALLGGDVADWLRQPFGALLTEPSAAWLQTEAWPALQSTGLLSAVHLELRSKAGLSVAVSGHCKPGVADQSGLYHWLFLAANAQPAAQAHEREEKQVQEQVRNPPDERLVLSVINAIPSPMAYWDKDLICRFSNQRYVEWFGKTNQEMESIHIRAMMGERLFALNRPYIEGALAGIPQEFEREIKKPDGSIGYTLVNYVPDIDRQGIVQGFNALVTNVTRLREAAAALRLSASVFDSTSEGILVTDMSRKIVSANPAVARITGYSVDELVGQSPHILDSDRNESTFYNVLERSFMTQGHWSGEHWLCRKDREVIRVWTSLSKIHNEAGQVVLHLGLFSDITERHGKEELMRHMALHDSLTDLPNRMLLTDRLDQLLASGQRSPHPLAVLFLDLDGFKQVNDRLGHDAGDIVLKTVAQRLLGLLRAQDTVARLGGDEFVVILDNPEDRPAVEQVAMRIVASINLPIAVQEDQAHVGCSIGISMHPKNGTTAEALLKSADAAMYVAKAEGKNAFRFGEEDGAPGVLSS